MSITVLPKEISELIAAGEVIERPASVIKELVENAVDAGAKRITVEIKRGGTTYMRITDDGCGIAPEEVATAFLRHATSKIAEKTDLENIHTLGFRGEALASVAAVAQVEVLTKRREDPLGLRYCIAGSAEESSEPAGCPDGTTLIIRNLFYNVPVRQKFLKKDVTEGNAVAAIVQKLVLSHPEIAFTLIRDNKRELQSAGDGTLLAAVYAVYGRDFAQDLLAVDYTADGITVRGYAVKPLYAKNNRAFQVFFINGRYVRSITCSVALEEAYRTLVMTGKFPACVLTLTMPPAGVDVNVHPAKAEVRFTDEKRVGQALFFAVKNALMQNGLIYDFQMKAPTADWLAEPKKPEPAFVDQPLPKVAEPEAAPAPPSPLPPRKPMAQPAQASVQLSSPQLAYAAAPAPVRTTPPPMRQPEPPKPAPTPVPDNLEQFQYLSKAAFQPAPPPAPEAEPAAPEAPPQPSIRVLGEAFSNYILAEAGDSLYLIDKHAAHERVLFEQFLDNSRRPESQMLLGSSEILLSMAEFDALETHAAELGQLGFAFDFSNRPHVAVCAVPITCAALNVDEMVLELADALTMGKQNLQSKQLEDALHTLACKAAIRSGDQNALCELQALAEAVWTNEKIRHCPHGRPVLFSLTKQEIEKQFKRT